LFGFLVSRTFGLESKRVWLIVAIVVLSHFLLDGLVHIAGLPLLGENSPKLGLGLGRDMTIELGLETLMAFLGFAIYWKLARQSSVSRYGMAIFMLLFMAMTWRQLALSAPPEPRELTVSWLVAPLVLSAVAYGLDSRRVRSALVVAPVPKL